MSTSERVGAALALLLLVAGGCTSSRPSAAVPVLRATTGVFAIDLIISEVGGRDVKVSDPVPVGSDPYTWEPASPVGGARELVVTVGGGFEAGFDRTLPGSDVLTVPDGFGWLSPPDGARLVGRVAAAMEAADPPAAGTFRNGADALVAEVQSDGIDYSSTLSTCRSTLLVTPDRAFAAPAATYGLTLQTPTLSNATGVAAAVKRSGAGAVFSEPWAADGPVVAVARSSGVAARPLDTLVGEPAGGYRPGTSYSSLLEQNLGVIASALHCGDESQ